MSKSNTKKAWYVVISFILLFTCVCLCIRFLIPMNNISKRSRDTDYHNRSIHKTKYHFSYTFECIDGIEYIIGSDIFTHGYMSPHIQNSQGEVYTCQE